MKPRSRVLVTGVSGLVGKAVALRLLNEAGFGVRGSVRTVSPALPPRLEQTLVGDLNANTVWQQALCDVDVVIHCAARVHVMSESARNPLQAFREANVDGTRRLAQEAAARGARRLIYLSSIKVNGEQTAPDRPFSPTDLPAPADPYGISKWEAEQALREVSDHTGLEVVIIRPPLVYGPGVKGNFGALVKLLRTGLPLPLGAINNRRSLVALDNLVSFIALCAADEKSVQAANQVFLIADGEDLSTTDLLRKIALAYGLRPHLISVRPSWLQFGSRILGQSAIAERLLSSLQVDSTSARELLGWRPVVTFDEQLRKMSQHDATI